MKKYLAFLLFSLTLGSSHLLATDVAIAQDHPENNGLRHGLGFGGTVYNTWGFTYRHFSPSGFGVAANAGGWFYSRNRGHIGAALGLMYSLAHHTFPNSGLPRSSIRVYGVAYGTGVYQLNTDYNYVKEKNLGIESQQHSAVFGIGVGPGVEYFFTENFAIHFEVPWMTKFSLSQDQGLAFESSYPNVGGGFTYYF